MYMQLSKAIDTQRKQRVVNVDASMSAGGTTVRFYHAPAGLPQLTLPFPLIPRDFKKFGSRSRGNPAGVSRGILPLPLPCNTLVWTRSSNLLLVRFIVPDILQCIDFGVLAWNCLFMPPFGEFWEHISAIWRYPSTWPRKGLSVADIVVWTIQRSVRMVQRYEK